MKFFRIFLAFGIFLLLNINFVFPFGKKDSAASSEKQPQTEEIKKDFLKIDFLLDTKKQNQKNHLNWKTSAVSYKDSFDAVSGASKSHSTKYLREATLDAPTKSLKIPRGLRALCLFAVSAPDALQKDEFSITSQGKKLVISFSHRGNAYRIESDSAGEISVPEGFSIIQSEKPAEKTDAPQKDEKQTATAPEESEEESSPTFSPDIPSYAMQAIFSGKLKAALTADGILSLRGTLRLAKHEEPKAEAPETDPEPDSAEENGSGPAQAENTDKNPD